MRRILIAGILASPLLLTAAAYASSPAEDAAAPAQVRAVSTGVTDPRLIQSGSIQITPEIAGFLPFNAEVVLQLNLDEKGMAQSVQVIKSLRPDLDARVVEAVKQFRWKPATLDNKAVPVDMTLNVVLQH